MNERLLEEEGRNKYFLLHKLQSFAILFLFYVFRLAEWKQGFTQLAFAVMIHEHTDEAGESLRLLDPRAKLANRKKAFEPNLTKNRSSN